MPRRVKGSQVLLALGALGVALLFAAIVGLWVFSSAAAPTFHPSPQAIPSITRSAPSPQWAAAVEQAQRIVRAHLADQNLPGLSVAVGAGREIVWAEGFGWADLGSHDLDFTGQLSISKVMEAADKRVGVSPDTRFRIVGASMALTSAAAGLLIEKGALKLDDEIQAYVPAFPKKPWPVRLGQLMAHQAGLPNDGGDEAPLTMRCDKTLDGLKLEDFAERPLLFEPGTRYHYSTFGWVLVSAAIEAASNEPFFTFMRTRILEPLGMRDTLPDAWKEPIPNRSTFYHPRFGGDPRYGPDLVREGDHSCWAGAGAYLSTPSDLVRFGLAMNNGTLLKPDTAKQLRTPQNLASGEATEAGLGWRIQTVTLGSTQARMVGQRDMRSVGAATSLLTFPDLGLVVAVTTNTTFGDTESVALKVAEVFAGRK